MLPAEGLPSVELRSGLQACLQELALAAQILSAKYMKYYETRDLKAFSPEPLLVYPTHYTGQPGYLSDTETSTIWDNETVSTDWDRTLSRKTQQQGQIHTDAQNKDALPPQPSLNPSSARDEL
ncbi:procollagen galactosyltransferase 2-like [Hemicordylus capensis]|uniref:procollagen galactosyltransferase 2-like n=1 Tax=Hemicordylus capensis TaxID=884348 RepID=UPI0023023C48|nr:procollagen galactosyltransferase 2-like [Hemicordylus capensis]